MAYFIRVVCIISLMIAASCALYALVVVYFIGSDPGSDECLNNVNDVFVGVSMPSTGLLPFLR